MSSTKDAGAVIYGGGTRGFHVEPYSKWHIRPGHRRGYTTTRGYHWSAAAERRSGAGRRRRSSHRRRKSSRGFTVEPYADWNIRPGHRRGYHWSAAAKRRSKARSRRRR